MAASQLTASLTKLSPLAQRLIVAILLIPLGVTFIWWGGWPFALLITLILARAAWEYWRLFHNGGFQPSVYLLVGGAAAMSLSRFLWGFDATAPSLVLLALGSMALKVVTYLKGAKTAALDFNIELAGILYLGWLGAYLITLRQMPQGFWWFMLVLPAIWISDGGAYLVGSRIGKHKMASLISPNKSWEGYVGGVLFGIAGTAALGALWQLRSPVMSLERGLIVGAVVSILSPVGDLFESMLKRGMGVKDAGRILPGHGGFMDRIDSWLWAAPLGFYLIKIFFS
jgi:phosphatidate cytidylyltransferase